LALLMVVVSVLPVQARGRAGGGPMGGEQEVLRDFEQILDLWRDGRYGELFERTTGGKGSREQFVKRLASAPRKPACCWEKLQDARVSQSSARAATVRARLGFEGGVSGTEFVTKAVKLKREDGYWAISQSDLFSLANLAKRRTSYKYLPIQRR